MSLTSIDADTSSVSAGYSLTEVLTRWASISSGSYNQAGLKAMLVTLCDAFAELPGSHEIIPCQSISGEFTRYALRIRRQGKEAQKTILLNGHYDTVYGATHRFQSVDRLNDACLRGPGVTDMKGGLLVLLEALKRWEASEHQETLSWEVLLTPDEEIGSPFSIPLLKESAARCDLGLVYESAYPDGGFVRSRKGSATYAVTAHGKEAHVGRNFKEGINAITSLCRLTSEIDRMALRLGIIANVGKFTGGEALNVVPDRAEVMLNVRAATQGEFDVFEAELNAIVQAFEHSADPLASFTWSGGVSRPPKTVDGSTQVLFDLVAECAQGLGQPVSWRDTGGGSDGSNLAAYGLPNIDNLGVRGGAIHSDQEYVELASLEERIALSFEILKTLAKK
jgi:glutamate carboxypeptidase